MHEFRQKVSVLIFKSLCKLNINNFFGESPVTKLNPKVDEQTDDVNNNEHDEFPVELSIKKLNVEIVEFSNEHHPIT